MQSNKNIIDHYINNYVMIYSLEENKEISKKMNKYLLKIKNLNNLECEIFYKKLIDQYKKGNVSNCVSIVENAIIEIKKQK